MAYTLAQSVTQVRSLLDEATAQFWTDAELESWINQGCEDVARRAETLWQEVTINVTPLVQNYPFPLDFLNCHRAEFPLVEHRSDLQPGVPGHQPDGRDLGHPPHLPSPGRSTSPSGGTGPGLLPDALSLPGAPGHASPSTTTARPSPSRPTQNIDVQPGWEDIVFDYAVYKAKRKAQDPTWQEAFQLYNGNLAQMINKTRNMTDQGEQITSGIPQWPVYAYSESDGW